MTDINVRPLHEDDWQDYRSVRLAALRESPEAFAATLEEEEAFGEELWRERMRRSARLIAERAGQEVGVRQVQERVWLVTFMHYDLGYFDDEACRLEPIENPFAPKVLPMCPE